MLGTILIVLLILILVGAITPVGGGIRNFYGAGAPGYSLVTIILIVVLVLLVLGRI